MVTAAALVIAVWVIQPERVTGQTVVRGRVTDERTGQPVAGAVMRDLATGASTQTDRDGRFRLTVLGALQAHMLGYVAQTVTAPAESLEIRLEPDPFTLVPVLVTSTRSREKPLDQPSNVTVLDRGEVERRMLRSIEDLIRFEPGVQTFRQTSGTDPFHAFEGFRIRGVSGNRVQMRVDGSRVQERIQDGTRDLVDVANMKAIEIVRGPSSVLWGSDALGGLVAFTTKNPEDYLSAGADRRMQLDVNYSDLDDGMVETLTGAARRGPLELLLSYSRRDAGEPELTRGRSPDGVWPCPRNAEATPCNRLDPMTIGSNNVLGKVVWNTSETNRFKLTGEYFTRRTAVDQRWDLGPVVSAAGAVTATQTSFNREQRIERWRISAEQDWRPASRLLDAVTWRFTFHPQATDRNGDRRRTLASGDLEQLADTLNYAEVFSEADLQFNSTFSLGATRHALVYGVEGGLARTDYERVDVTRNLSTGTATTARAGGFNFANADTRRLDFYLQDEIRLGSGRVSLIPGVRVAHYAIEPRPNGDYLPVPGREPRRVAATAVTPKVGVMVRDGFLSLYAQYAEGFKMPTAQQLYTSLPGVAFSLVPNPDLEPESVDAYEFGVRGEHRRGFFSVNAFLNDYTNFIQSFVNVPNTSPQEITYDNLASVQILGVELSAGWRWSSRLASTVTLSYQRGDERPIADSLRTVPFNGVEPLGGVATLRYVEPQLNLDVEAHGTFQTRAQRVSSETVFRPGSYDIYGLVVGWSPHALLRLRASVDNLLDRRYFLSSATVFARTPASNAVAATNPIELQVQPGRNFRLGATVTF